MSGPVWRREDDEETTCDLCLGETTTTMVEGQVEQGEFHAWRRLCLDCYRDSIALIG